MVYTDTIAAIATALSSSGIGIIRISGSDAVAVAERMFEPAVAGKRLSEQKTYTIHYGYIRDGEERIAASFDARSAQLYGGGHGRD